MTPRLATKPLPLPSADEALTVGATFIGPKLHPKGMPLRAEILAGIHGRRGAPLHYVGDRIDGNQVPRIEAGAVATDVVEMLPGRYLSHQHLVRPPMNEARMGIASAQPVAANGKTRPDPTLVRAVGPTRQKALERGARHFVQVYSPAASLANGRCNAA